MEMCAFSIVKSIINSERKLGHGRANEMNLTYFCLVFGYHVKGSFLVCI